MARWDERPRVEIAKPGFAPRELSIGPQDFGPGALLQVELERTLPPAELVLELDAVPAAAIGPLELRMALAGSDWRVRRWLRPSGALLELGEVPAGRYRVELLPELDDALVPERQARWLETSVSIECRPSTAERVRVPLRRGGRVAFHVARLGAAGAGNWQPRGPSEVLRVTLFHWDLERGATVELDAPYQIDADGIYWSSEVLLPGDYRLDVVLARGGGGELVHAFPFSVAAGAVTDVDVFLD